MLGLSPNSTPRMPRKSLRGKFIQTLLLVAGMIGIATAVVVSVMTARASSAHLKAVQQYIEDGIASKGKVLTSNHALALRGLTLDNAFVEMQELLGRAVKDDGDLVYGVYVSAEGDTLALTRRSVTSTDPPERDAWRGLGISERELVAKSPRVEHRRRLGQDLLEVAAPVVGENGEILGTLRYGLSTRRMQDALSQAQADSSARLKRSIQSIGLLVSLTVLIGIFISRLQAVRITRPIAELTAAAEKLAAGDRSVQVSIRSEDELQLLGASFNRMVADLDASYRTLEDANRTLETKVEDRTRELGTKNRDMRLLLDNVDEGFVTLSPEGVMAVERSRQVSTWFGETTGPVPFWSYLAPTSAAFADAFEVAWSQIADDFLPIRVCLGQLPDRLSHQGKTWSFRYLPFFQGQTLDGVLVAISDVTERLAREQVDAEHYDLMQAFQRLVQDRTGFEVFLVECSDLVNAVCSRKLDADLTQLKRALHTLKGNSSSMGLSLVARLCHELETQLAERGELCEDTRHALEKRWGAMSEQIASAGGMQAQRTIEIPEREYTALLAKVADGSVQRTDLVRTLRTWEGEPVEKRFRRLAERAVELARRSGKGDLRIAIDAGDVRVDGPTFAPFFSELIHVVRNAVDHGIEAPEERARSKKPATGMLSLRARTENGQLEFEIADDGAGIDWEAIEHIAIERGLPHENHGDLLSALCQDGVTTRSHVTELSGRGVGMSAFRERVRKMGGELEVRSIKGAGTTWLVRFEPERQRSGERMSYGGGLRQARMSMPSSRQSGTGR